MGLRIKSASLRAFSLSLCLSVFLSFPLPLDRVRFFVPLPSRLRLARELRNFPSSCSASAFPYARVSLKKVTGAERALLHHRQLSSLSSFSPSALVSLVRSPAGTMLIYCATARPIPRALKDAAYHPRQTRAPQCPSADFDNAWQVASSLRSLRPVLFFARASITARLPQRNRRAFCSSARKWLVFLPPPFRIIRVNISLSRVEYRVRDIRDTCDALKVFILRYNVSSLVD